MNEQPNYFLQTIEHMRHYEEVLLYGRLLSVTPEQCEEVTAYLEKEYYRESLNFPSHTTPAFDKEAALWGAQFIYVAVQLLLYRENKPEDLDALVPHYTGQRAISAQLSADLMLRFLPDLINHLQIIDPEDALLSLLEQQLALWPYSAVKYVAKQVPPDLAIITPDPGFLQLYIDRIISYKNSFLAVQPILNTAVKATLGIYRDQFWDTLPKTETIENGTAA